MKKILLLILALVFFRCDDFVPVKVQKIDVDVYGTSRIKRHNSKCRYYKNSKGYCTEDREKGTACKICGG